MKREEKNGRSRGTPRFPRVRTARMERQPRWSRKKKSNDFFWSVTGKAEGMKGTNQTSKEPEDQIAISLETKGLLSNSATQLAPTIPFYRKHRVTRVIINLKITGLSVYRKKNVDVVVYKDMELAEDFNTYPI